MWNRLFRTDVPSASLRSSEIFGLTWLDFEYTDLPKYGRSYFSPIYNTFKIVELVGIDRLSPQLHVYNNYINIILL
jgi:hypothetical protein